MQQEEQQKIFQNILEQHKGILFKVARTYCRDEEDRQDLIQEIMIQIWQSLHKYNDKFQITTWLYRISLNVAISHYRKRKVRKDKFITLKENFTQISAADSSEKEQLLLQLERFISELKEMDKALVLLYLENKNYNEISEILGITVSNVSTKVGRIKEKLKRRFTQNK
ncbi:RNA polymerase sigma factor [Taibaiella helva]|uniref:RNA polymerase sigma factor n=1 Tax=Taibaiella helva TaxID=2301235 RepID=UPI000E569F62|nr:RNA polymerase sigma factor [Taibaiella helva]